MKKNDVLKNYIMYYINTNSIFNNEIAYAIDMLLSDDYLERQKGETIELGIRIKKLNKMLEKHDSGELDFELTCDVKLLEEQLIAMMIYLSVLIERNIVEQVVL